MANSAQNVDERVALQSLKIRNKVGKGEITNSAQIIYREPLTGQESSRKRGKELHEMPEQPTQNSTGGQMETKLKTNENGIGIEVPANHTPEDIINDLLSQIQTLRTENLALQQAAEERDVLADRLTKANKEKHISLLKIKKLGDIIVKRSEEGGEPLDEEIQQEVCSIRNKAAEIIKSHIPREANFREDLLKSLGEYYQCFYMDRLLPTKNTETRRRLLISLVYTYIYYNFFDPGVKRFGLPEKMEMQMAGFERMIERHKDIETEDIVEWRTRTIAYAGRLNLNRHDKISQWTRQLSSILRPMLYAGVIEGENPDPKIQERLESSLYDLCSASLKLALRFRSYKTLYELKAYSDDTSVAFCKADMVQQLYIEGPRSKQLDPSRLRIFCTEFGALVKTVTKPGDPPFVHILVPAQIIVYEDQRTGPDSA